MTLRGQPEGTLSALRMTDIYFRDVKTMADAIEMYGTAENNSNPDRMLFGNMALVAGRQTARVASSSAQYWFNNFSASFANIDERFKQGSALLGMDFRYGPYRSLYHQFMADTGNTDANSSLLLLLFSPELLEDYAYASSGFGLFHEMPTGEEDKTTHSAAFMYGRAQREINRVAELGGEDFTEEKKDFFAEVRALIHPDIMKDPAKVRTSIFDLFPLSPQKQKKFQREMDNITRANMGDWLSQNTLLMPGSLQEDIRIKALYKRHCLKLK